MLMAQYTEEDKAAFARKDRMIVAQTCLERAIEFADVFEIKNRSEIIDIAETFYTWVFGKADGESHTAEKNFVEKVNGGTNSNTGSSSNVLPVATKQQLEWLKKIEDKYGYTKEDIWKKCKMYPGNKDEAVEVTKLMKG
jgi:hypothetical protein